MKQKILLMGGGGHGKSIAAILQKISSFELVGYLDPKDHGPLLGAPYLGDDSLLPKLMARWDHLHAALGVGKVLAGGPRLALLEKAKAQGLQFPPIVAPSAIVDPNIQWEEATVIFDGAIVQTGTRVGRASIINTGAILDHDCLLGEDVHLCPGSVLSGGVRVGSRSLVGAGASVHHSINIGEDITIGVGAAVVEDCQIPGVYVGIPARRKIS